MAVDDDLRPKLKGITLEDEDGNRVRFRPMRDITALEAALVGQLFVLMTLNRSSVTPDWRSYLRDAHPEGPLLERHFIKLDSAADEAPPVRVAFDVDTGLPVVSPPKLPGDMS
jgi:hypothetical protein